MASPGRLGDPGEASKDLVWLWGGVKPWEALDSSTFLKRKWTTKVWPSDEVGIHSTYYIWLWV